MRGNLGRLGLVLLVLASGIGGYLMKGGMIKMMPQAEVVATPLPTPLSKYSIESLTGAEIEEGKIEIAQEIKKEENYTSYLFFYEFEPALDEEVKKISGLINIPKETGPSPLILMIRGYVDQEIYETGMGTASAGKVLAQNGYITLAPDFLGYGGSDPEASDILETRFQTYVTVLSLLKSLDQIDGWDGENLGIWAHSNGGQIALTILVVTRESMPTTLWAPVTKPFPYNVLYYTDESDDGGKLIRQELAKFEAKYDVDIYSFTNYLNLVRAPIQIHQGTSDDAVPWEWSQEFAKRLEEAGVRSELFIYSGSDHNLRPDWESAMARDLNFFATKLKD